MDLTLILTESCNLRCTYCYQPSYPERHMDSRVAIAAIERSIEEGANQIALTFFGGEPLLRKEALLEILVAARALERRYEIPVTAKVSTNGLLVDEAFIAAAAQLGLFISLSCDGVEASQNSGRPTAEGDESAPAVYRALELLVRRRLPFATYSVITPNNVTRLDESIRMLWERGARILITAMDYTATWRPQDVRTLKRQYRKLAGFYRDKLREREHFHLEPFDSRISQRTRGGEWKACAPGVRQITVAPDGTLYGCVEYFHRRLMPLGNLETWLDRDAVKALSCARGGRPPECADCGVRDRCVNSCACVNLRGTGEARLPSEISCLLEQLTIQCVDESGGKLYREKNAGFLVRSYSQSYHLLSSIEAYLNDIGVKS